MNDPNDSNTLDLFGKPGRRGPAKSGHALTPAQKQAAYRARQAQKALAVTVSAVDLADALEVLQHALYLPSIVALPRSSRDRLTAAVKRLHGAYDRLQGVGVADPTANDTAPAPAPVTTRSRTSRKPTPGPRLE